MLIKRLTLKKILSFNEATVDLHRGHQPVAGGAKRVGCADFSRWGNPAVTLAG